MAKYYKETIEGDLDQSKLKIAQASRVIVTAPIEIKSAIYLRGCGRKIRRDAACS